MSQVYVFNQYGGPETEELIEGPVPRPGPGELLIEVRAAGVNPADAKIRSGALGRDHPLPAPLGQEAAGIVAAVGKEVNDFTIGDEVLGPVAPGHGGFAEHTIMAARSTVAKPEEISFADAATIPVAGAAAYDATHQIELEADQKLLILGAGGGVGLMAAQIGGVHQFNVIGVASEGKRDVIESTGATFVPSGPGLLDRLRQIAPDGVDVILDLVGSHTLREAAPLATEPARIISAADPTTATDLGGSALSRTAEAMAKITDVIKYDLVNPHVTDRYPLTQTGQAIAAVEAGHTTGKIVIEISTA